MTESSPGLRRATDRQILMPRSAKAGPLALPPAVPKLSDLENVEVVSGEIAMASTATPRNATISCIIPCYNEQDTIADVLKSLLGQTRLPDVIHVIINNTDDDTPEIARSFEGRHTRTVKGEEFVTVVHVHDMGSNPDKKVGALNYGYFLSRGYDYILGVDGDTTLARDAVERLELEMTDDPRIGGLSAIYSIDKNRYKGLMARFLIAGQRAQFAAFNMDNLLRGRNMAVLGGQCSLFSIRALETVMVRHHQQAPWVRDSEVEDSKLSLQIKDAGYSTKISSTARAFVGPMTNLRALHGQQVKWNFGAIDLFWPGTRGDNQGQPLHPNLRLRWYENIAMAFNIASRLGFLLLLVAALSIHAFVFNPIWLIPPAVAALLNLRLALSMKDKSASDILYAALALPAELYMWIRMGHFVSAWTQFLAKTDKDNWAAQANAEKGKGSAYVMPLVVLLAVLGGATYAWSQQSVSVQSAILSLGWPILYIATIAQTVFMMRKLFRRHRGFAV
ncbi:glycosyltransferase family 2 protein [Actinoplanes sp. NPDC048796]|uniref:glycosyltransferase family 2 protein n=1 Tax=unclassified Actinoplanes TaxID=2626549 RepID=UPI0033EBE311